MMNSPSHAGDRTFSMDVVEGLSSSVWVHHKNFPFIHGTSDLTTHYWLTDTSLLRLLASPLSTQ